MKKNNPWEINSLLSQKVLEKFTKKRAKVQALYEHFQDERLYLRDLETGEKRPIAVSCLPFIIDDLAERQIVDMVTMAGLAKYSLLLSVYGLKKQFFEIEANIDLQKYLEEGPFGKYDEIILEIMSSNPLDPFLQPFHWRHNTYSPLVPHLQSQCALIETNGGEPQGDVIIEAAIRFNERVLELLFDLPENSLNFGPYPCDQTLNFMKGRSQTLPNLGFMTWKANRTSLSLEEANHSVQEWSNRYGGMAVTFDPREIEAITLKDGRYTIHVLVDGKRFQIDYVRRLFCEPMENVDLLHEFREKKPSIYYKFIGKYHGEHNPEGFNLASIFLNPLNSWSTDKKLDAILGNPDLRERFKVNELLEQVLAIPELVRVLNVPNKVLNPLRDDPMDISTVPVTMEVVIEYLNQSIPAAYPLRRQKNALYNNDSSPQGCLSEEQIYKIQHNREKWVLKNGSLIGHSGENIYVGCDFDLHEVPTVILEQGGDHDRIWELLIAEALHFGDSLVVKNCPGYEVPVLFPEDFQVRQMRIDINPQVINGIVTQMIARVSSQAKTNITGGYGGIGCLVKKSQISYLLQ